VNELPLRLLSFFKDASDKLVPLRGRPSYCVDLNVTGSKSDSVIFQFFTSSPCVFSFL
jgi:hypothetical protein